VRQLTERWLPGYLAEFLLIGRVPTVEVEAQEIPVARFDQVARSLTLRRIRGREGQGHETRQSPIETGAQLFGGALPDEDVFVPQLSERLPNVVGGEGPSLLGSIQKERALFPEHGASHRRLELVEIL